MSIKRFLSLTVTLLSGSFAVAKANPVPSLPEPVTNNAVAKVHRGGDTYLVSMMGLGAGKTYEDVHNKVWRYKLGDSAWRRGQAAPSSLALKGRLASVALGVKGEVYLFGGYTVAEDHSEVSSPDNFRYDPENDKYTPVAMTPVPVDDAVAVSYMDRYIYLISGWHNDGNVNLVQVYDIETDSWAQASPLPGLGVFGNAGGIVDNKLLVCDGVVVEAQETTNRKFVGLPICYFGVIDKSNASKIRWFTQPHPTGVARYRMAATGVESERVIVFVGGAHNPYNYNGIGYDGEPSEPDPSTWVYEVDSRAWRSVGLPTPTMDHRGLLEVNESLVTLGGMSSEQTVLNSINAIPLKSLEEHHQ